ncbi:MAG: hypothetical protein ACK47B_05855 [Armatimonadota bacterium]
MRRRAGVLLATASLLTALLLIGAAVGDYALSGGPLSPGLRTQFSLVPASPWRFDTLVGCGPGTVTYVTTIGPVQIVREGGRSPFDSRRGTARQ